MYVQNNVYDYEIGISGKIKIGESPADAVCRELGEEVGWIPKTISALSVAKTNPYQFHLPLEKSRALMENEIHALDLVGAIDDTGKRVTCILTLRGDNECPKIPVTIIELLNEYYGYRYRSGSAQERIILQSWALIQGINLQHTAALSVQSTNSWMLRSPSIMSATKWGMEIQQAKSKSTAARVPPREYGRVLSSKSMTGCTEIASMRDILPHDLAVKIHSCDWRNTRPHTLQNDD